jgi:hypothetical protein
MNDIEILEETLKEFKVYGDLDGIQDLRPFMKAIENLLKERQADKDRINRYENDIDILLNRIDEYKINTVWKYTVKEDYIPKSLVIEKIKEVKQLENASIADILESEKEFCIDVLQELLGEKQDLQINKER